MYKCNYVDADAYGGQKRELESPRAGDSGDCEPFNLGAGD